MSKIGVLLLGALFLVLTMLPSGSALAWKCHHRCPTSIFKGRLECWQWKKRHAGHCRRVMAQRRRKRRARRRRPARQRPVRRRPVARHSGTVNLGNINAGSAPVVEGVRSIPINSDGGCPGAPSGTICINAAGLRGSVRRRSPGQKYKLCNIGRHRRVKVAIGYYDGRGAWRSRGWHAIARGRCISFSFGGSRSGYAWYAISGRTRWAGRRGRRVWLCASRSTDHRFNYRGNHRNCGRQARLPFRFTRAARYGGVVRQNIGN